MHDIINILNNNKILWGVTMMLLNLGSRYVAGDLGKVTEAILASDYVKKVIVFSMFFVATRDILIALILTILYALIIDGILHEKRKMCMIPQKYRIPSITPGITQVDYLNAKKVVSEYEKMNQSTGVETFNTYYKNYATSIKMLNSQK